MEHIRKDGEGVLMDVELLNAAFENFTKASKSPESYYEGLQGKVGYLTAELEKKNRELNEALEDAARNKRHYVIITLSSVVDSAALLRGKIDG
jgi:metal-responsive CopG/Arc/MetJ family transcriptional regulator